MSQHSLQYWMDYLLSIHPTEIDMSLCRCQQVYVQLNLDFSHIQVITVAGTNGKGTTCAMLEQAALLSGQSVAWYSSPHLRDYRERLRYNQQWLSEQDHCQAFSAVEAARQACATTLTFFEFGTLAALYLIAQQQPQVAILEVGLGGRLDATNIIDADIAVITSIGLDHQAFLGDTRDDIAQEKAGIMRSQRPVVIGEPNPPKTLIAAVDEYQSQAYWQEQDFQLRETTFTGLTTITNLPTVKIPAQNAATASMVVQLLAWPLSSADWQRLYATTSLVGRLQLITRPEQADIFVDLAHNPHAAVLLADYLTAHFADRHIYAICGMLKDKDIKLTLSKLTGHVKHWHFIDIDNERGASAQQMAEHLQALNPSLPCTQHTNTLAALGYLDQQLTENDLVLIFGSFYTVGDILTTLTDQEQLNS